MPEWCVFEVGFNQARTELASSVLFTKSTPSFQTRYISGKAWGVGAVAILNE